MKIRVCILFLVGLSTGFLAAQELKWRTGLDFFFDNTEYAKSSFAHDQTLAGVALTQELGWRIDQRQSIMTGADLLKKLGSDNFINSAHFLAYYQLEDKNTLFKAGVFSRSDLLDDYSNLFFTDSIAYFHRTMDGFLLKKGNEQQYYKLWLDWTGLQSAVNRESFFFGASAYKALGTLFFTDFQSYLFHFATTSPNPDNLSVSDNFMGQLSAGFRLLDAGGQEALRVSAGLLAGYERDRHEMDNYKTPLGTVLRADGRYRNFGMHNLFYIGNARMSYYPRYNNQLYWGNPYLRGGNYFQNKIYWKWMDSCQVKGELAARTHFSEGKLFFEQMLTLRIMLAAAPKKTKL